MAIAQDKFTLWRGIGYEGQISTIEVSRVLSRLVEVGFIPFGRAVIRGDGRRSCAPVNAGTTSADIIGFSVRSMAEPSPTPPSTNNVYEVGYPVDHVASVLNDGSMLALCVDGANAGDPVVVITAAGENLGRLTARSAGVTLDFVKWVDTVAAGELGEIQVSGVLAAPVSTGAGG